MIRSRAMSAPPPAGRRRGVARRAALAWAAALVVASVALEVAGSPRSIRFEQLYLEHGLSQGTVNCLLQDSTGFLWLGTQDGLNRYDGYGFEVFEHDPLDAGSLASSWIEALVEDPAGELWIGTDGGGLARWRRGTASFEHFRHDPGDPASLSGDRVRSLVVDRSGALWIGTFASGVNRLDPVRRTVERFRHDPGDPRTLSGDRVRALFEDSSGALWIGTLSGLNRFDPSSGSFERFRHRDSDPASLSDDRVLSIAEHAGALWVGTESGLHRLAAGGAGFVRFAHDPSDPESLSHDRVRALFEDREQRLWAGTDGGLNLLASGAGADHLRFVRYRHDAADPSSLSSDRVTVIAQDEGGVVWVGTQGGGVDKFDPRTWAFAHYKVDPSGPGGLSGNAVFAFSEDADGRLWIGTLGGLDVLERGQGGAADRFVRYRHDPADPSSLPDDRVSVLLHDREGYLWAGVLGHGLSRLDPRTGAFEHFRPDPDRPGSLGASVVTSLYEDREGTVWAGTFDAGVARFERESATFVHYRHDPARPSSLADDQVNAFAEHAGGDLWVGTHDGGLNRLDRRTGTFRHIRHDPDRPSSLSSDTVYALHVDAAGVLWVGTSSGLDQLESLGETAAFRHYFERDGLPSDVVWGIQSDARGRLWLSTNDGLARFDPATGAFKSFNRSHGLQSNEFNFNAHYRSPSGELFFGGVNGFNAFFPEEIEPNPHVPPVVLTSFSKVGRPVAFDRPLHEVDEIALGWRDYFFSFELAALDLAAPRENRYRYKLEGFDADWVDLGHRRQVTFTNLDAGRYTLRAQGSNNDGVWNEQGAAIRIVVAPPPWQTWWAYALYALALAAAVGGSVLHHHRKLERERAIARRERRVAQVERAQAEEHRRMLAEREALIEELEAKNAELERFNYTVSHDLKSPLVTIKGFLGLLQKDAAAGNAESLQRDVHRIAAATDRMGRLLEELLELSRVGSQVRPAEEVALGELAREALELIRGHAGDRAIDVSIDPGLPTVVGDRLRLLQLYQNLLGNAIKYMGDQQTPIVEVGCVAGAEAVELHAAEAGETVLYVRDNGIGIEAAYQDQVFGLFERLDAKSEGTGVGLALAKRIVEMHGGRIWVESEGRGCGSCFCFTLPETHPDSDSDSDEESFGEDSQVIEAGHLFRKGAAGE